MVSMNLEDEVRKIKRRTIENSIWIHTIMRLISKRLKMSQKDIAETREEVANLSMYKKLLQELDDIKENEAGKNTMYEDVT